MSKKLRPDEMSDEDWRLTRELGKDARRKLSKNELKVSLRKWAKEYSLREALPVASAAEIISKPARFAKFTYQDALPTFAVYIIDKVSGEILEFKARGIRLLNEMSLAGVSGGFIDRDALAWLMEHQSARKIRSGGVIR